MEDPHAIVRLAQAFGLQVGYVDYNRGFRGAAPEVIGAVVRALGGDPDADVDAQVAARDRARWQTPLEPVVVAWDGVCAPLLRLRHAQLDRPVQLTVHCEDGTLQVHEVVPSAGTVVDDLRCDGAGYACVRLTLPGTLPMGYHRLELDTPRASAVVFSAARRVWSPADDRRHFGLFAPLYSLRSERSLGVADFTDLGDLFQWLGERGGSVVGTLPLLSAYLDEPCEASPYVPCSRLAWNELFLDIEAIPEFAACPEVRALQGSPEVRRTIAALRSAELVDHRTEHALRRRLLAPLSARMFSAGGPRMAALEAFAAARPELVEYARFRAAQEKFGALWDRWPTAAAAGTLRDDDLDPTALRDHIFAQFCCHEQLGALAARAEGGGLGLYLDLPVGVHGLGFDPWRHRDVFVHGLATGAPPDLLFAGGQNWAFPPLSPDGLRAQGHAYTIAMIRNHLRYAKVLRIDHVMGLHRLYVIPQGARATDGIYLSYAADEMYAILSIESHRSGTLLVGEDLGTVPPEVHASMREHGVMGMHVVEYAARGEGVALAPAEPGQVASINTHDMPMFAAFWDGDDIDDRVALGWIDGDAATEDHRARARLRANLRRHWRDLGPLAPDAGPDAAFTACVDELGRSDARLVLVTLEDLWGERQPHNVPGTWLERPNWRRRARHRIDALGGIPSVVDGLDRLRRARLGATAGGPVRGGVTRLSADDVRAFADGTHETIGDRLGAHPMTVDGVAGTYFGVWAPSASAVSVFGDFDGWDRDRHPLAPHAATESTRCGIWEGFVPGAGVGDRYVFHVVDERGGADQTDPLAAACDMPPRTASIVTRPVPRAVDDAWEARRTDASALPVAIYEVDLASWRRVPEEGDRVLGYRELGAQLGAYATRMGFTHVQLLPEPRPAATGTATGTATAQAGGWIAPCARFGTPGDFTAMVDALHAEGIAVLLGSGRGGADGRPEVRSLERSRGRMWRERHGVDAQGGDSDAAPSAAEWTQIVLRHMARDPIHRGFHQHELTAQMAHPDRTVLPLAHDALAPGESSILARMPGDRWQQFANVRLLYGAMWGQPGTPLLFMGAEFAQARAWNPEASLDWHLLGDPMHRGVQDWVADLNRLRRDEPALHGRAPAPAGFTWVEPGDTVNSVLAWLRHATHGDDVLVVCNFTPVPRTGYRVGVPTGGQWRELVNSDATQYGGSGVGNFGGAWAEPIPAHGHPWSLALTLPPLGVLMLRGVQP